MNKNNEIINICFVANYNKTYFFDRICSELIKSNIKINWIVVNVKLYEYLKNSYPEESILYLNKNDAKAFCSPIGDFRINELVYGDRTLKTNPEQGSLFLENIQKKIYDFIKNKKISKIFGEITWAHELLIHRMSLACSELNVKYYCPHTTRIPGNRFGFFKDEFQSNLCEIKNIDVTGTIKPIIAENIEKPDYLKLNNEKLQKERSLIYRLGKIKRYFSMENIDKNDPTIISDRLKSLIIRAKEELNSETYRFINKRAFDTNLINSNYIFYGLHKQPESSIDVIGRYYENQLINIINIWRSMPADWYLLVKEHTNAIGDRSWLFYRKLKKLKNVILIKENEDSHKLIKSAAAVFTVSGTMAYEAALMNIPSYTFADVFFNKISTCKKIDLESLRRVGIAGLLKESSTADLNGFNIWLSSHTAPGIVSDHISNPNCMNPINIEIVAKAFLTISRQDI